MTWERAEQVSLVGAGALLVACSAIGFRFVASPYFRGYASAAGVLLVLNRVAASRR